MKDNYQRETMMSVLFDLIMADEGAAEDIGTTENIYEEFRVLPTKMLDPLSLRALFSLIDPASTDIESWIAPLYEEEEGVWVFQLPPYFIEKLASLLESERSSLAKRWGQTEELRGTYELDRRPPEEVAVGIRKLVDETCAFAFEAREKGKQVFLRVVL
jgi:hypothetical protein